MFTEIRLCNPMTYFLKDMLKSLYMVKFKVSYLNRLKIIKFCVHVKYMNKPNIIFNKTVTKLVTILTTCFFPYLNLTSYLYLGRDFTHFFGLLFRGQLVKKICLEVTKFH